MVWKDPTDYYFVSEFLQGGDLFELIQSTGPMQVDSVRFFTAEILAALHYLHDTAGYLHRDLKPENCMLTSDGHIKVIDFGSAAAVDGSDGVAASSPFVGTAKYLSPELLDGKVCASSDLWALGIIAFQLLTGRTPFVGATEYLVYQAISDLVYEWPPHVDSCAQAWVDGILTALDSRMGCNSDGSCDLQHVAKHAFLECLTSVEPHTLEPPIVMQNELVPFTRRTVSDIGSYASPTSGFNGWECDEAETRRWSGLLLPNEVVLLSGVLRKHIFLRFTRERRFLLLMSTQDVATFGRLIYIDESKNTFKGEVPWTAFTIAKNGKNVRYFDIETRTRTFCLEDTTGNAQVWVSKINALLKQTVWSGV